MDIVKRRNKYFDVDAVEIQFLDLPNEMLTKIVLQLNSEDRRSLGRVNARLRGIDRRAGHRSFTMVHYNSEENTIKTSEDGGTFRFCVDDLHPRFFNRTTTRELTIENYNSNNDEKLERSVIAALKPLDFHALVVLLHSDSSIRILHELVRKRKSIEYLMIRWMIRDEGNERAKKVVMDLPPMEKIVIYADAEYLHIDDEIFLHVVSNTKSTYTELGMSASALVQAFVMVCNSETHKEVKCFVPSSVIDELPLHLAPIFNAYAMKVEVLIEEETDCVFTQFNHHNAFLCYCAHHWQVPGKEDYNIVVMSNRQ